MAFVKLLAGFVIILLGFLGFIVGFVVEALVFGGRAGREAVTILLDESNERWKKREGRLSSYLRDEP